MEQTLGRHRLVRALAVSVLSILASGCAIDFAGLGESESDAEIEAGGEAAPSSTSSSTASTTTSTSASSAEAAALRTTASGNPDLPPDVTAFFTNAADQRLDELGVLVCGQASADQTAAEFGATAIVVRDQLSEEERNQLDLAEFGSAYRALAETYCPAQVPADLDVVPDTTMVTAPPSGADIAGYRQALPQFLDPGHQALLFVDSATDARLDELQQSACAVTTPDLTTVEFGFIVLDHRETALTADERATIDVEPYAEMFGSFIGWFCPERLPAGDA